MRVTGGGASFDVDAIVFDKDGTLIDLDATWLGVTQAWIDTAAGGEASLAGSLRDSLGVSEFGSLLAGEVMATGTFAQIGAATEAVLSGRVTDVAQRLSKARERVMAMMRDTPVAPIGDVRRTLLRLHAAGLVLCVASSDNEEIIRQHMDQLGVSELISEIVGGDGPVPPKPHPAGLEYLSAQVEIPVDRMLMIGDSHTDLGCARSAGAAGILAVAPNHRSSLIEELADGVLASIEGLIVQAQ